MNIFVLFNTGHVPIRVDLVMDTRITLQRRKFQMRHTVRMVLHYSASRVLDQTICKLYKLNQYVILSVH